MRPVTDAFLRTLHGSHRMIADARIVAPGQTGVDPTGTPLTILAGDVQMDGTADVRSTLDISVVGGGQWPTRATDPLAPYGNEVFVRRGVDFGGGRREWVSLGYHRIDSIEQPDAPNGPIQISASDRMAAIRDARLTDVVQYAAGTTLAVIVSSLVTEVHPAAVIEWDDATDDQTVGRALIAEEDRYGFLDDLFTSRGKVWYWDHRGILRIESPPDPAAPVWTVSYGQDGVLLSLSRILSREGVYNGVVASGEAADTDTPVRALVVDNNPTSPTFWGGPFGKVPRFYSSPFITTTGQASSAGAAMLTRSLGLPYSADFTSVPNPALTPFDPVRVRFPGRSEVHVIESLTVPLVAEQSMPASTREQTTTSLGVFL